MRSMATKKRGYDQLTGGTGDTNPQTLRIAAPVDFALIPTTNTTYANTHSAVVVPIPRYPSRDGTSIVMEILKITWELYNTIVPSKCNVQGSGAVVTSAILTTNPQDPQTAGGKQYNFMIDPRLISAVTRTNVGTFTNADGAAFGNSLVVDDGNWEEDFTDGNGHGLLVATDTIYLNTFNTVVNVSNALTIIQQDPATAICTILYRQKAVTLQEYVGIVQSQQ